MPRPRHVRPVLFALFAILVVTLAPSGPGDAPSGPLQPAGAAAARPAETPDVRRGPNLPRADPRGPEGETGAVRPPSPAALTGYVWPLPNARLTLPFTHTHWGSRLVDGELFHDGIDLATFCGDRIFAAHDGVVLAAGRRYDAQMGWQGDLTAYTELLDEKKAWGSLPIVVVVDDGNGYRSLYAHVARVTVKRGDRVSAGQLIGYEGDTGRASGCHLHYGLFSPLETAVFEIKPSLVKSLKLPRFQTARIDPLLVLPPHVDPLQDGNRPTGRPATLTPDPPVLSEAP